MNAVVGTGSSAYYRLHRDAGARRRGLNLARVSSQPAFGHVWRTGERFAESFPTPIRCALDPRGGPDLPDAFLAERIPLFSDKLIAALRSAGVDNLDCYDVELLDDAKGKTYRHFKATNVVGKVQCVDLDQSEYDPGSGYPMFEFTRIVLDPSRVRGIRMFRLAENTSYILIAEGVKHQLERETWNGVAFPSLNDPSAY